MSTTHRQTLESIPWLVTGRLPDDERRRIEQHLSECTECQRELSLQQRIHAAMNRDTRVDYAPSPSLQKLWARIEATESTTPRAPTRTPRSRLVQWLAAAVVVEAVGITLLAMRPNEPTVVNAPPAYRTVTTTEIVPQTAVLRVVFATDVTVAELNRLLQRHALSIVGGPTATGVYTLATTAPLDHWSQTLPATLTALRAHSGVRFAEPVGSASRVQPFTEKAP